MINRQENGWQLCRVTLSAQQHETAGELLQSAGALSVTLLGGNQQPVYEPLPGEILLWQQVTLVALFPVGQDLAPLAELLELLGPVECEYLAEQEWSRVWEQYWQPRCFSDRLWVVPGWDRQPRGGVQLRLDPGLAFGTGSHPTTALCLSWLAEHLGSGRRVVDYGCGSGVLAVAALLLGAESAIAVDIDPQAVLATRANAEANGVSDRLLAASVEDFDHGDSVEVDLLVANILCQPLLELAPRFSALLRAGGDLVLSGLLNDQADRVSQAYEPWFDIGEIVQQDGWIRITGIRRND
ncbi:MAG TPA: 50S ribosomal protein L11 methyltransferase [Gammaproteobacteria bacterium]|nr:50S ribosomal protein L11 methyltransferase [Gammaproteobacteria bacterium]